MDEGKLMTALLEGFYVKYMTRKEELVCLKDQSDALGLDTRLLASRIDELCMFAKDVKQNVIRDCFNLDLDSFKKSTFAWAIPDEPDMRE